MTNTEPTAPKSAEEIAYDRALAVECPRCLASPGRSCTDPRGETTRPNGSMVLIHRPRFAASQRGQ